LITGIGTDLCSIARLEQALQRTPTLSERLFHPHERELSNQSLAARFAAKEALAKALGDPRNLVWNEIEVVKDPLGKPSFEFHGSTKEYLSQKPMTIWLSLSHETDLATALVVVEA
jgi:holo-[acyl-carrier protein] synthase